MHPDWKTSNISVVWRDGAWFVMVGASPHSRHSYRVDAEDAALLLGEGGAGEVLVKGRWGEVVVLKRPQPQVA